MYKKGQIIDYTYQLIEMIGKGTHGEVYTAFSINKPKETIVMKIIDIHNKFLDKEKSKNDINSVFEMVKSEFQLLKSLNHENIVKVFEVGFDRAIDKLYYTMEYLKGKTLFDFFKENYSEENFLEITYQTLLGLSFLHDNKIIHYDIKPENIFICNCENSRLKNSQRHLLSHGKTFTIKIFDFGLSEIKQKKSNEYRNIKGTIEYMAPEVLITPELVTYNADLYSLAVALLRSIAQIPTQIVNYSSDMAKKGDLFLVQTYLKNIHNENLDSLDTIENKKIVDFLSPMLNENPIYRTENSRSAIEKLNFIFNKKFKSISACKQKSFLNNDLFIVRERKIEKLISLYDEFCNPDNKSSKNNIIYILGHNGSGKRKIMDNFYYSISVKLNKVIKKENNLLKQAEGIAEELLNLDLEIENFVNDKNIENGTYKNITYIFYNLNNYNEISKRYIFSLLENYKGSNSVFFILSAESKKIKSYFLKKYNTKNILNYSKDIKLKPLVKKDVTRIIDYFMGETQNFPQKFSDDLIFYSDGNFKKIMYLIDRFRSEKVVERVSNLVVFKDLKKYNNILKTDYKKHIKDIIINLTKKDLLLVKLIFISYYPLNKRRLNNLLLSEGVNKDQLKKILPKLIENKIIQPTKNVSIKGYSTKSYEVQNFLMKSMSIKETKNFFKKVFIDNVDGSDNIKITQILKILQKKYDLSTEDNLIKLSESIRTLYSHYSKKLNFDRKIEIILLNLIKITVDKDLKFRLNLELVRYFSITKSYKNEYHKLKVIENNYFNKKMMARSNCAEFILLKFNSFHPMRNNYDLKHFFFENIDFLYENIDKDTFYITLINLLTILKEARKNVTYSLEELIEYLSIKLNNENDKKFNASIYQKIIFIYKIDADLIKNDNDNFNILKSDFEYLKEQNLSCHLFYIFFEPYTSIAANLNIDIEDEIIFAQNIAIKEKDYGNLLELLNFVSNYYFDIASFKKSLIYNLKKIEYSKKLKVNITIPIYLDLMTTKYMLMEPISDIINLFKNVTESDDLTEVTSAYLNFLYNRIFITHQVGDFTEARKLYREYYYNANQLNLKAVVKDLFTDLVLIPELFTKDEFTEIIRRLYEEKTIKKKEYKEIALKIEPLFKYRIRTDFNPLGFDRILKEPMSHMTPFMIVEYIKTNKALPSAKTIFKNIPNTYRNSSNISNYTCFLVTQFFFLKNDDLLNEIFNNLHKFYVNGYYLKVIYFLIPIIDFMIIAKIEDSKENRRFILLLNEIFNGIMQKMDNDLLVIFKQTYIYKRKRKLDKKLIK